MMGIKSKSSKRGKGKGSIPNVKEAERERECPSSKHTQRGIPLPLHTARLEFGLLFERD
jgi:hypothetical protein